MQTGSVCGTSASWEKDRLQYAARQLVIFLTDISRPNISDNLLLSLVLVCQVHVFTGFTKGLFVFHFSPYVDNTNLVVRLELYMEIC